VTSTNLIVYLIFNESLSLLFVEDYFDIFHGPSLVLNWYCHFITEYCPSTEMV